MNVTIYHNPDCGTSRSTLAIIRNTVEPTIILYLETPPSNDKLKQMINDMGISARELLRTNVEPYNQLCLNENRFTDDEIINMMTSHPILINRPIVVTEKGTLLCRPSENVLKIL